MTKREICERLLEILVQRGGYEAHIAAYQDLRNLILDLAAPDDHFADVGKMVREEEKHEADAPETELGDKAWYEICPWRIRGKSPFGVECSPLLCSHCARKPQKKEPPVLIYEENGEKVPCPVCGALAYIIKNAPKIYCKRCAKFYTREEDAK